MAERKFKPGHRDRRFTEGRMSEERLAWLYTYIGQFVLMHYENPPEGEEDKAEPGPTLRLMLPQQRGRSLMFNITALTHEELAALKELFDMMFEIADPIVRLRDEAAQDALERGDDSFIRVYRQVPRLVVRRGQAGRDGAGVLQRPDDDAPGHGDGVGLDGGVRVEGEGVAEEVSADRRAQDDDPEADESQDVRDMGGLG